MKSSKPPLRALIVSSSKQVSDSIAALLPTSDYDPSVCATSAGEAKRLLVSTDFDLLIINAPLSDEFGLEFALHYSSRSMGILLLCKSDVYDQVAYRAEEEGILTLSKPITRQTLFTSLRLLSAVARKLSTWEAKNRTLEEKMGDIRIVNRAKWLLISHLGMTEEEAHYYIEKQAMDLRISRREAAELMIRTYDQ